jgi:hypothetical protein
MGADLTCEDAVEEVGALAFQSSEGGGDRRAGWPRNVDVAAYFINVFWAILAVGGSVGRRRTTLRIWR